MKYLLKFFELKNVAIFSPISLNVIYFTFYVLITHSKIHEKYYFKALFFMDCTLRKIAVHIPVFLTKLGLN